MRCSTEAESGTCAFPEPKIALHKIPKLTALYSLQASFKTQAKALFRKNASYQARNRATNIRIFAIPIGETNLAELQTTHVALHHSCAFVLRL